MDGWITHVFRSQLRVRELEQQVSPKKHKVKDRMDPYVPGIYLRACLNMQPRSILLLSSSCVRVCRITVQANLGKTNSAVNFISGHPPRGLMQK
jgi:hypothetical protein